MAAKIPNIDNNIVKSGNFHPSHSSILIPPKTPAKTMAII